MVAHGESDVAIAARLGITVFTVGKWRWFIGEGLECLSDRPCSGKLRSMTPFETRNAILSKLEKSAHKG